MTFHITKSGSVELVDSYGNGKSERGNWSSTPATLICDDGDGYYDAWKYSGKLDDAVEAVAGFYTGSDGLYIVEHITRGRLDAVPVPDDFWIEDSSDSWSDVKPNLKKYSNAVAW
tara:strand:- start:696 stop:1040 length:345 start_codon:yes stop_codon:yes gene_type:complete